MDPTFELMVPISQCGNQIGMINHLFSSSILSLEGCPAFSACLRTDQAFVIDRVLASQVPNSGRSSQTSMVSSGTARESSFVLSTFKFLTLILSGIRVPMIYN